MFSIQLTKEHREKLIEMCRKLYPENNWEMCNQQGSCGMHSSDENKIFVYRGSKPYSFPESITHWFEFCFLFLVGRIQDELPKEIAWREQPPYVGNVYGWKEGAKWTLYSEFMFSYPKSCFGGSNNPPNPIDFLYKEFKKITQ